MEINLQQFRGTNVFRVEFWEDDYLRQTPFRIECFSKGWLVRGCPLIVDVWYETKHAAMDSLKLIIGHLGIDKAQVYKG